MKKASLTEKAKSEISHYSLLTDKTQKKINLNAVLRFVFFVSLIGFVFLYPQFTTTLFLTIEAVLLAGFAFLVKYNIRLRKRMAFYKALKTLNEEWLSALNEKYEIFHDGDEFTNPAHDYSYDTDIFGKASVFQMLNRTVTLGGKIRLAEKLLNIETDVHRLRARRAAVEELSALFEFRQHFAAEAACHDSRKESHTDEISDTVLRELLHWAAQTHTLYGKIRVAFLLYLLPALSVGAAVSWAIGIVGPIWLILIVIGQIALTGVYNSKVNAAHSALSQKSKQLANYEALIRQLSETEFESDYLKQVQSLINTESHAAIKQLSRLRKLLKAFDMRLNFLAAIFLNYLLVWDLQVLYRLEKLKDTLAVGLPKWFDALSEFDALMSLADFAYSNPDYAFPEYVEDGFVFDIKNGMHPLLPSSTRVGNDFWAEGTGKLFIITGANMSGKSTFLRTVAVNMILACTGTKVCADAFRFKPVPLYTSVRTTDSVQKNESYFFAELMRLKTMTDRLKTGEQLFVILDEMLKGTNSDDKHLGSKELIKQLVRYNVFGFAATHDTELGVLEEEFPGKIHNRRFEAEIRKGELFFDYKIKQGVSKNLNAVFLMKKYGIIPSGE